VTGLIGVYKGAAVALAMDSAPPLAGKLTFAVGASGFATFTFELATGSEGSPARPRRSAAVGDLAGTCGGVVVDKAEQHSSASVEKINESTSVLQARRGTGGCNRPDSTVPGDRCHWTIGHTPLVLA